jgi:hypothetical protein
VLSFVISAAVVYFVVVLPVARLLRLFEHDQAVTERNCPACDRSISINAHRCPECTTMLSGPTDQDTDSASGQNPPQPPRRSPGLFSEIFRPGHAGEPNT